MESCPTESLLPAFLSDHSYGAAAADYADDYGHDSAKANLFTDTTERGKFVFSLGHELSLWHRQWLLSKVVAIVLILG